MEAFLDDGPDLDLRGIALGLRLTFGSRALKEEELPAGLKRILVRAGQAEDFADLKSRMESAAERCYMLFRELIEEPAAVLPPVEPDSAKEAKA